jgi:hypothetical protein
MERDHDAFAGYLAFARTHGLAGCLDADTMASIIMDTSTPEVLTPEVVAVLREALAGLMAYAHFEGYTEGFQRGTAMRRTRAWCQDASAGKAEARHTSIVHVRDVHMGRD